jgi:hypothetical protein
VGAAIGLVTAFSAPETLAHLIAAVSAIIALVSLFDLVMNLGESAYKHEELYKRFKQLQAEIDRHGFNAQEKQLAEWQAQAQLIRVDEPPTLWAVYAKCWNQVIERHGTERRGYYRRVAWWQSLVGGVIAFNPQDFPPQPAPAAPR